MEKTTRFAAIRLAILVLILLQTMGLALAAVLMEPSRLYRLALVFVGLGIVATPILMKGLSGIERPVGTGGALADIVLGLYQLAAPWMALPFQLDGRVGGVAVILAEHARLPLAASCIGFAVMAFVAVFGPVDNVDGLRARVIMRVLRAMLGAAVLWMALALALPGLRSLGGIASKPLPVAIGNILWTVNLAGYAASSFRFYRGWLSG